MTDDQPRRRWGLGSGLALGLSLGGADSATAWDRHFAWVERAEALGLHSVWVPEMHFAPNASASPLLALAAFGARTRRLRLGTTSLLLPIHDPIHLAAEIAALDTTCDGRVILGLGRGFRPRLFRAFGVDAASKRDRFDAALDAMLRTWSGPGQRPAQRPHPPLAVAAFGPLGLRQAARHGLPYLASPLESVAQIAENLRLHRAHLPANVPADSLVVPVMRTIHVAGAAREAARVLGALHKEAGAAARRAPPALARALRADPEERAIVGTPAECIERLAALRRQLNPDLLIARAEVAGASPAEREASLERLAGAVLPALHRETDPR